VQTRAADSVALGSLAGSSLDDSTILPAPGAPEPVGITRRMSLAGCSCTGSCGCGDTGDGLGGFVDQIPGGYLTLGVAAFFAWKLCKKR
jgi:hypothetical protein